MKPLLILILLGVLSACSYFVSQEELARQIQSQMQSEFNSNSDYQHYRLTVEQVRIVEREGIGFKAVSELSYQGERFPVNVNIRPERGGYNWNIENEDFSFIDEIEIQKYEQQLDRELAQFTAEIEQNEMPENVSESNTETSSIARSEEKITPTVTTDNRSIPVGNITAYTQ